MSFACGLRRAFKLKQVGEHNVVALAGKTRCPNYFVSREKTSLRAWKVRTFSMLREQQQGGNSMT